MRKFKHLHHSCVPKLELPIEERIIEISKPRWIGYTVAHNVLQRFEDLYRTPRSSRMQNLMLIGRTNNGKTDLLKKFCRNYLPDMQTNESQIHMPVKYIQAPPSPNESDLYSEILTGLYERVPTSSTTAKRTRVVEVLRKIGVKVMCIDELHNSLAGSTVKRQQFLNAIKYLGNELSISFIISGTDDLTRAVSIDNQIQNRFQPILIPKWSYDKEYLQLLRTFEAILPLKEPSSLHSPILARKLLAMSEGTIGELSMLLNSAAIQSLRSGEEQITSELIDACNYTPPSERKRELIRGI